VPAWRSLLFTPALEERRWRSAHTREADAVIVDLEDSILPSDKEAARMRAAEAVSWLAACGGRPCVRVNNEPSLVDADIAAISLSPISAVILPKTTSPEDVLRVWSDLSRRRAGSGLGPASVIAVIEDPLALERIRDIADADGLSGIALGSEDFALSMGREPHPDLLVPALSAIAYAAAARGLMCIGMACGIADYNDITRWSDEALRARRIGASGAMAIHPAQIGPLNAAFSPTAAEIDHARRVVAAFEAAAGGVCVLDGRMLDRPVVERARRLLGGTGQ